MPNVECQSPQGPTPSAIFPNAGAARWSSRARDRDIAILSEPLTGPQWKRLAAFACRTSRESLRLRFGHAADFADERTLKRFFGDAGCGSDMLWMLEPDGTICGVAHLVRLGQLQGEIALIVRSDRMRQGLGATLLRAALAHAAEQALSRLEAFVLYENIPMLRLARKVGFEPRHSSGLTVALDFDLGRMRTSDGAFGSGIATAAAEAV
jgi:RimJ/RimL family protein N-acetyltransferase